MNDTHMILAANTLEGVSGSVKTIGESAWGAGATDSLPVVVGHVISILLGVLGLVFLVLVVYAGFLYITAQGEDKAVKKAKSILAKAVIGMMLAVGSYAITTLVTDALSSVTAPAATSTTE